MIKELIICSIILASIFSLDYVTQKYTDKAVNETIDNLNKIKEQIKHQDVDNEKASKFVDEKLDEWLKFHDVLAFYIEHNELEKVETNYVAGKSFIQTKNYNDALSELDKTIFVLNHINDKYSVNLANIF